MERRIRRDEERIRNGLVVSNGYLQESANRLVADLDRRVRSYYYPLSVSYPEKFN